jgi:hypothetical protein
VVSHRLQVRAKVMVHWDLFHDQTVPARARLPDAATTAPQPPTEAEAQATSTTRTRRRLTQLQAGRGSGQGGGAAAAAEEEEYLLALEAALELLQGSHD